MLDRFLIVEMVFWKVLELHSRATNMLMTSVKLWTGMTGGWSWRVFFSSTALVSFALELAASALVLASTAPCSVGARGVVSAWASAAGAAVSTEVSSGGLAAVVASDVSGFFSGDFSASRASRRRRSR